MKTVLVVDDEEEIREVLIHLLKKRMPATFFEAENGQEALEALPRVNPDLVITDISMPKMNGIEFARQARESGYKKPILFVTAHSERETTLEAWTTGYFDYITKPFDSSILEVVQNAIAASDTDHEAPGDSPLLKKVQQSLRRK